MGGCLLLYNLERVSWFFFTTGKRLSDDAKAGKRESELGGFVWMGGNERKEKKGEEWERRAVYQLAAQEAALA